MFGTSLLKTNLAGKHNEHCKNEQSLEYELNSSAGVLRYRVMCVIYWIRSGAGT